MKILMQSPADHDNDDPVYSRLSVLMRRAARFKRPDTELIYNPAAGLDISNMLEVANLGSRFVNDTAILNSMLKAATPDIDGIVSHCYFDPALWPARQMLDIPVVGLAESVMNLATQIGRRFAVMPVSPRYVQAMEDMIGLYGHRAHAIDHRPVRAIEADEDTAMRWWLEDRLDRLVEAVKPVARGCIADGADVLILGCGFVSVLLSEAAGMTEIDGVPILTPTAAAVKAIETMVDLKRGGMKIKSDVGYWGRR